MFKRSKRDRNMLAILLAGAMIISSCTPVMGGETAIEDLESPILMDDEGYDLDAAYQGEAVEDSAYEIASDDGNSLQESNTTTGTNYYYGPVWITKDGVYDGDPNSNTVTAKPITVPGLSYDNVTYTITLDNVHIGSIVDDFVSPEKSGSLDIHIYDRSGEAKPNIILKGHNFIGGYSTFSRLAYSNTGYSWSVFDSSTSSTLEIKGDGDLLILGELHSYPHKFKTDLPVWVSKSEEGLNLKQLVSEDSTAEFELDKWGDYYYRYMKIGGEKPNNFSRAEYNTTVSVDLGTIGGHTVSVCYTDNICYSGRKIVKNEDYALLYDAAAKDYEFLNEAELFYGDGKYNLGTFVSNHTGKSKDYSLDVDVYVDGKLVWNPFVKLKLKNNVNVSGNSGKQPCFSFVLKEKDGIRAFKLNDYRNGVGISSNELTFEKLKSDSAKFKQSGLDKNFIKAVNDYFKKSDNWINFNILPMDIKGTGFKSNLLRKYTDWEGDTFYPIEYMNTDVYYYPSWIYLMLSATPIYEYSEYSSKIVADYKKKIKVKNGVVKKVPLFNGYKALKQDKKYTEGNADLRKDFHVKVSDNGIVITGQGNYMNSITVPNPYS